MGNDKMNATVWVVLSQAGKKDAVKRGLRAAEKQQIRGEVGIEYLERPYTKIDSDGVVTIGNETGKIQTEYGTFYSMDTHPENAETAAEWWETSQHQQEEKDQKAKEERAAEKQQREEKLRAQIASDASAGIEFCGVHDSFGTRKRPERVSGKVPSDLVSVVQAEFDRLRAEYDAEEARLRQDEKDKEAARAAAKQARDEHVLNYVKEYGTASQRERLEADLLPISEAYDACRDATFAAYSDFDRYKKMTSSEVRDEYDDYSDVEFVTEDCMSATDDQWVKMKELRAVDPSANVTLKKHIALIDDEIKEERYGILVEIKSGPVRFSREFAC